MSTDSYRYDVALSFAGEQRAYVEEVAVLCRERGISVFYDVHEQAGLWGKNLYEHMAWVYSEAARYCVVFLSADYARKAWTRLERRSAQGRTLYQGTEYILPVLFDDTQVPGIWSTIGYLDARTTAPADIVAMLSEKLNLNNSPSARPAGGPVSGRAPDRERDSVRNDISGTVSGNAVQAADLSVHGGVYMVRQSDTLRSPRTRRNHAE